MTPEIQAAMSAVGESFAWGYGLGLGFVVLVLITSRKGGES